MHLTSTLKYRLLFSLMCCVSFAVWMMAGRGLSNSIDYNQQLAKVGQVEAQLSRRVEKAIDFSVIAYSELLFTDTSSCNSFLQTKLRRLVQRAGGVTDIYVVTGDGLCTVFGDASYALPDRDARADWLVGRNPAYRIGVIEADGYRLLAVSRGLDSAAEVVIALNPERVLFDVVQTDLSAHTQAAVLLGEEAVAIFEGEAFQASAPGDIVTNSRTGVRYPVTVRVRADSAALREIRDAVPKGVWISWVFVGLLSSFTLSFFCLRRFDPVVEDVRLAIRGGHIQPHFQPIVEAQTGRVLGCEALARWIKDGDTITSPDFFVPIVEKAGLDDDLLAQLIATTALELRAVFDGDPSFYVGFNVTPAQISRPCFAADVLAMLKQHDLAPHQICIEITERQVIQDIDTATLNARALKAQDVCVAIDDAGTGHNGLAALQLLDVDVLKIDKFFVDGITADPKSRIMLDTFVSVAGRSDMRTVAEGVETLEQVLILAAAGVHSVQGYVVSRPIPGAEFEAWVFADWADDALDFTRQNVVNL